VGVENAIPFQKVNPRQKTFTVGLRGPRFDENLRTFEGQTVENHVAQKSHIYKKGDSLGTIHVIIVYGTTDDRSHSNLAERFSHVYTHVLLLSGGVNETVV
jgi:hypothetical protein